MSAESGKNLRSDADNEEVNELTLSDWITLLDRGSGLFGMHRFVSTIIRYAPSHR
jgi:hypothetical protein